MHSEDEYRLLHDTCARVIKELDKAKIKIKEFKNLDNWISVEDEMPPKHKKHKDLSISVVVQTKEGNRCSGHYFFPNQFWILDDNNIKWNAKYWQPLPKARKF